jgi:hypothetical protein
MPYSLATRRPHHGWRRWLAVVYWYAWSNLIWSLSFTIITQG